MALTTPTVAKAGPSPAPPADPPASGRSAMARLIGWAGPARLPLLATAVAGVGQGVLLIAQAGLFAWIVHRVAGQGADLAAVSPAFLALLVVFAGRAACVWGQEIAGARAAGRVKTALRDQLARHLLARGPAALDGRSSGAVAAALVDQVEALDGFYARFLPHLAVALLVPLAILVAIFPLDWVAGLLLLATAPLIPGFMALIGMGAAALSRRQMRVLARLGGYVLDRLQGLPTLRLFGQDQAELGRIRRVSDDYRQRTMAVLRVAFLSSAVLEFFSAVAIAMVAVYIGMSLLGIFAFGPGQDLTLFSGLFILLLAPEFFQPLRTLAAHYHDRAAAIGAVQELAPLLDAPPPPGVGAEDVAAATAPAATPAAMLRLDRVDFAYAPDRPPVLSGFSLIVAAGERVALVGPSGVGKSTVLHLLLGFLAPLNGTVRVAGQAPTAGRAQVSWIGQRPHLFHGTLADNLRLARPDADDAAVARAVAQAGLETVVARLPDGLATRLGEDGHGLSGGEAQRVAIARALLKDAPILLLDEPTAHLDGETEAAVLAALAVVAAGRTVLIATHSLAGIGWAERQVRL